jgi:hypothetical protein
MFTMHEGLKGKVKAAYFFYCLFGLLVYLYLSTAFNSFGYDDEYYNIRFVREMNFIDMLKVLQSEDLHPPLSYIINYCLFKFTHSWTIVRVCSALFFLVALWAWISRMSSDKTKILGALLLGFNPTILLWVVGLRWYAYMIPLILILSILPNPNKWYYWPKFFVILLAIWFLGYVGFFLAIPYFLYYWLHDTNSWRSKIKRIIPLGVVFALLYSYQAFIFLTVHSKTDLLQTSNQQVFDLKSSLVFYFSSVMSNQGVFPISLGGGLTILGSGILYISIMLDFKTIKKNYEWLFFVLLSGLFLVSGIAGKVRNLVLLEPSRNSMFLSLANTKRKFTWIGFLLLVIGNGFGVYNVMNHTGTTKNAWNIPVQKTLSFLENLEKTTSNEIYFTHHPTFDYHLTSKSKNVICFYNSLYFDSAYIKTNVQTLQKNIEQKPVNFTFILNYKGRSITQEHYDSMLKAMGQIKADSVKRYFLDKDPEFTVRRKLFPDYPLYTTTVIKYYGVKGDFSSLESWERNQ